MVSPIHRLETFGNVSKRLPSEEEIVERPTQFAPTLLPVLVSDENAVSVGMIHHVVGNHHIPPVIFIVPRSHAVKSSVTKKQLEFAVVLYGCYTLLNIINRCIGWQYICGTGSKIDLVSWIISDPYLVSWIISDPYYPIQTTLPTNMYKLREWIERTKLNTCAFSRNPLAIRVLERNPHMINWWALSGNPHPTAMRLLEAHPNKIEWRNLSANPAAMELLTKHPENIFWSALSGNPHPAAIALLEKHVDKIHWESLSLNGHPDTLRLLEKYPDKIAWDYLSCNPAAIPILEKNPDRIQWDWLSCNPRAMSLIEDNPDKINWHRLSHNPDAIALLEANLEKIGWCELSRNPAAMHLLEANPDKISWDELSGNPAAMHLLEANPDKISWGRFSQNPAIFVLDYQAMKESRRDLHEDLMKERFHPRNMDQFDGWGFGMEEEV